MVPFVSKYEKYRHTIDDVLIVLFFVFIVRASYVYITRVDICEILDRELPVVDNPLPVKYVHVAVRDIRHISPIISKLKLEWFFPGSEVIYWTDEKIEEVIFPEFRELWESLPYKIMKIDMARCMILYKYGGVVLDEDIEVRQRFGERLEDGKVSMIESHLTDDVHFSIMASPPGHIYWNYTFNEIVKNVLFPTWYMFSFDEIRNVTGEWALTRASRKMFLEKGEEIVRIPFGSFTYPWPTVRRPMFVLQSILGIMIKYVARYDARCIMTLTYPLNSWVPAFHLFLEYILYVLIIFLIVYSFYVTMLRLREIYKKRNSKTKNKIWNSS